VKIFRPLLAGASLKERLITCLGAMIGIVLTIIVCARFPRDIAALPLIVAPLGASAVLVFAVPSSPLAQPWPVIGGNVISTLIGVTVFKAVPDMMVAAGLAVGIAILVMSFLRCLHPPGGAAALTAVIGSNDIHLAGYAFAFTPVAINSVTLVLVAVLFHRFGRHSYPHRPAAPVPLPPNGVQLQDIDAALEDMHESFDISREDLEALFSYTEFHAAGRRPAA
jgi:CBS domain-containing membrane protein